MASKLTIGKDAPNKVNVLIEIPQGGQIKYEMNEEGHLFVDRFLYTSMNYPFNYGFICGTKGEDGDPLDVIVLSSHPVQPGSILPSQPIGLLEMEDEEGIDTKIIAVPTAKIDPIFGNYKDVSELPDFFKNRIKHFFEHYKDLEPGKWVKLKNWKSANDAKEMIKKSAK
ncbi:MAG: inorganic diphosphatase [Candidatus Aenigmarchaeota archaeon]|nr:inorganic diphosphatase [Candidatus Aenigmarchaeota archaeon]